MSAPWTQEQHEWMHLRPDAVIRTGVIQPFWTRVLSPVEIARHTIDPFIASVRGPGPAVAPTPDPQTIAQAASRVADQFRKGESAIVQIDDAKVRVHPDQAPGNGIIGAVVKAAQAVANGLPVTIKHGPQQSFLASPHEESNMYGFGRIGGGRSAGRHGFGQPAAAPVAPAAAAGPPTAPVTVAVRPTPFAHRDRRFFGPRVQIPNIPAVPNEPAPWNAAGADRGFFHYYGVMTRDAPYRAVARQSVAPFQRTVAVRQTPFAHRDRRFFGPYIQIPNVPQVPNEPAPWSEDASRGFSHYYQTMTRDAPYRAVARQSVAPFNRTRYW